MSVMKDLISVIVPIYNVKPYLTDCIDSILKQTYDNLEIILVDDGSTDGSSDLCEEYKKKDERIKVIHQKNSGLTVTRRAGVNLAQGKYIGFVDGDDWIEPNMYQVLYEYIRKEDVDIVTSRGYREYSWGTGEMVLGDALSPGKYEISDKNDYLLTHLFPGISGKTEYMNGAVWNKLFRAEIIRPVLNEMDEHIHGFLDDTVCIVGSMIRSKSVLISHDILYHHRERADSFTYAKNPKGLLQVNYGYLTLKKLIEQSPYKEKILPDLLEAVSYSAIDAFNNLFETEQYSISRYFFKSQKIPSFSKILIYGAGKVGKAFWRQLKAEDKYEILGMIDKNALNINKPNVVFSVEHINDFSFDYIIIAVKERTLANTIRKELIQKCIPEKKIIWEQPISIFEYFDYDM